MYSQLKLFSISSMNFILPSIESNQSKEKTIFQEMQDTDIQYRNDNIQNVDYLCQKCGKNCDSNSSAVQCDAST
jgi:hypothetical protein